jgi:WD40 repeat protein
MTNDQVQFWNYQEGRLIKIFPLSREVPLGGTINMYDGKIFSTFIRNKDNQGAIAVWDVDSLVPLYSLAGHKKEVGRLIFDKNLMGSAAEKDIKLWDLSQRNCLITIEHPLPGHAFGSWRTMNFYNDYLFVSSSHKGIDVWDLKTMKYIDNIRVSKRGKATDHLLFQDDILFTSPSFSKNCMKIYKMK